MDRVHRFLILAATATLGGCAFWQPDWTIPAPRRPASDLAALVARAEELSGRAGDRAGLEEAMDAWRVVLSADPSHYTALTQLGNQQILFGAAHGKKQRRLATLASPVSSEGRVTISKEVRKELDLGPGDPVEQEVREGLVVLRRLEPFDRAFQAALSETMGEWTTPEDDEAFRDL